MPGDFHTLHYVVKTPTVEFDATVDVPSCFASKRNYAYLCGNCGLLWGRAHGEGEWIVRVQPCPDCGDGRLIDWYLSIYVILHFPIELLFYEVMIWHPQSPQPRQLPLPILQKKLKPTPQISPKALRSPLFEVQRPYSWAELGVARPLL